jgi:hypothetical protein
VLLRDRVCVRDICINTVNKGDSGDDDDDDDDDDDSNILQLYNSIHEFVYHKHEWPIR